MSGIRAISCDVHGTLILPQPSIAAIYADYARRAGYHNVDAVRINAVFKSAFFAARAESALAYGRNQEDARTFWYAVVRHCFQQACDIAVDDTLCADLFSAFGRGQHWRVLPHTLPMLDYLRSLKLPLFVCSNFDSRVHGILRDLGLADYFDRSFISAEIGMAKPDPRIMQALAAAAGCDSTQIIHIGDHEHEDGDMCRDSGAHWFAVDGDTVHLPALDQFLQSRM